MSEEKAVPGFVPLAAPVPLTEQVWPEGTVPLVCTRTMAYMHAKYIRQCIEGLLMQRTTFPVRVVIHDDASTDGTAEIIREYEERYPQVIKAIYQPENTFKKPEKKHLRNEVIRLCAVGKYSALCEGDDYWTDPLKLQKQVEVLEADPTLSGVFHYTEQRFEGLAGEARLYGHHEGKLRFTILDAISELALFHPNSFMYRTAARSFPSWASRIGSGDMVLFAMVAGSGDFQCIPEIMSVYRKHPDGLTTTSSFAGANFHHNRMLLWLYVDRHYTYRYTARCQEIMALHWQHILWKATPRTRLQYLREQFRLVPGWFLRHPGVLLQRLRQAVQR